MSKYTVQKYKCSTQYENMFTLARKIVQNARKNVRNTGFFVALSREIHNNVYKCSIFVTAQHTFMSKSTSNLQTNT